MFSLRGQVDITEQRTARNATLKMNCGQARSSYSRSMPRYLLIPLSLTLLGAAPPIQPVRYLLAPEISDGAITALKVEVRFTGERSGVTDFGWDDSWAGERKLWQWARDLRVAGAVGVEPNGDGHWRIKAEPGAELSVTYRIVSAFDHDPTVEDSDQPRPVIRPRWFYAAGNSLFGRPDHRENVPATFDWENPAQGIAFASDLDHLAGRVRKARMPGTVSDVLESIVIGGRDLRLFGDKDGSGVRVAAIGSYAFSFEQLNDLARRVIGTERAFWKADRRAPFLVTAAPIVGSPTVTGFSGTGRGDGFALWVDQRTPLNRLKLLLAHEYFHSWNPRELGTMSPDASERPASYWFSEGFTDYYARKLMLRAGLITPSEFVAQWNEMLSAYAASPARNMSGSKAASAFWDDESAQKLPYQRGAMLAAIWNAQLSERTHGLSTLDTLMRAQLAAAKSKSQPALDLFRTLATRYRLDVASDETRYLIQGDTIILPADTFAPCISVVTERRPTFSRGFDADATAAAGNIAKGVDPESPAFAAGLRDGMKIVARTEGEPDNALIPYALSVEDKGQSRTIRYLPQGRDRVTVQVLKRLPKSATSCR